MTKTETKTGTISSTAFAASTRTLQRRLPEERITFHEAVEQARREWAQHSLLQSLLELNQTAYPLGYEDSNSFIRAFHTGEGMPPGEWVVAHALLGPAV